MVGYWFRLPLLTHFENAMPPNSKENGNQTAKWIARSNGKMNVFMRPSISLLLTQQLRHPGGDQFRGISVPENVANLPLLID